MRRVNWWRGERVTFQERKKQVNDTELSLNRILHILGRQTYGSTTSIPSDAFYGWEGEVLPRFSVDISDAIDLFEVVNVYEAPQSGCYISAHIEINQPFLVYFKSGESRLIPSGTWDFALDSDDDKLTSAAYPVDNAYYAWLCFTADKAAPTTSGEISGYIMSAYDNWTSDGYVQNDDSLTIKPMLFSDVPSASLQDVIGVRWLTDSLSASFKSDSINPSGVWTRTANHERRADSDSDGAEVTYSQFSHMAPFAEPSYPTVWASISADGTVTATDETVVTATTFSSAAVSSLPNYLAMHIGVDDRYWKNYDQGNDALNYTKHMEFWTSSYPQTNLLSDSLIYLTVADESTVSGQTEQFETDLYSGLNISASYQFTIDLDVGAALEFQGQDYHDNVVFGFYYLNHFRLFRIYNDQTNYSNLHRWVTTDGTDVSGNGENIETTLYHPNPAYLYSVQPRNSHCLGTGGEAWIKYWISILKVDMDSDDTVTEYVTCGYSGDYEYSDYGIAGMSVFYDTDRDLLLDIGMSAFQDGSTPQFEGYWSRNPAAGGSGMSAIYVMERDPIWHGTPGGTDTGLTGTLYRSDENLLTSADNNSLWTHRGTLFGAYNQPTTANPNEFDAGLNYAEVAETSAYITTFENNLVNPDKPKLRIHLIPDDGTGATSPSVTGKVSHATMINDNLEILSVPLTFEMPLTGASASSGWIIDVIPIESSDTNNWYCMALENETHLAHIYKIGVPQKLHGWK